MYTHTHGLVNVKCIKHHLRFFFTQLCDYLFPLQHMMKACLSCYFLYKTFGESSQRENSLAQGILGDLTEKECLVFEVICSFVQPDS